jgi:hypothetical protein
LGWGEPWIVTQEKERKVKGVRIGIRNRKSKSNNTKKKNRHNKNKKFSQLGKSSGVIPLASSPGIGA